tara:strand:- start:639 stop:1247 length:609 start_codon:yes stop_codon:yes gene_type:complete
MNKNKFKLIKIVLFFLIMSTKAYTDNYIKKNDMIVMGKEDAPIKIKIFSSLTCPHCANFHIKVIPKLKEKYVSKGTVQLIFIDFPLDQAAFNASKLLHCAEQKKQIKLLDDIYNNQNKWTSGNNINEINNNLKNIAKIAGIDSSKFDKCVNDEKIADKIINGRIDGEKKYSISSTPTIIINEKKLKGLANFENIENRIKKLI